MPRGAAAEQAPSFRKEAGELHKKGKEKMSDVVFEKEKQELLDFKKELDEEIGENCEKLKEEILEVCPDLKLD